MYLSPKNISLLKVHQTLDSTTLLRSFNVGDAQLLPSPTTQSPIEIVESTEENLKSETKELEEPDVIGKQSHHFHIALCC